jgi:hypothetical protein
VLQAASDRIDQFRIPSALPFGFEPVIDRLDNLSIPALFWSQKIVLYQPVTDGAPRPERCMVREVTFRWWEASWPTGPVHVLMHQLSSASHPSCYLRGSDEVAFIDSQNFGSDVRFTNIMDRADNRIFE